MPSCSVIGCSGSSSNHKKLLSLHCWPVNKEKQKQWLEALGEENINFDVKTIYICSLHFDSSCFNRTLRFVKLRDDAVPSQVIPSWIKSYKFNGENEDSKPNNKDKDAVKMSIISEDSMRIKIFHIGSNPNTSVSPLNMRTNTSSLDTQETNESGTRLRSFFELPKPPELEPESESEPEPEPEVESEPETGMENEDKKDRLIRKLKERCEFQRKKIKTARNMVSRKQQKISAFLNIVRKLKKIQKNKNNDHNYL